MQCRFAEQRVLAESAVGDDHRAGGRRRHQRLGQRRRRLTLDEHVRRNRLRRVHGEEGGELSWAVDLRVGEADALVPVVIGIVVAGVSHHRGRRCQRG